MNLHEIQEILKKKLNTSERLTNSIIKILKVVKHQHRSKQDVVEIIEGDCAE